MIEADHTRHTYTRWTREELDIFEAAWRRGGLKAAQAALPQRSPASLRGKAYALTAHVDGRAPYRKTSPADWEWIDAALRRAYRDGKPNLVQLAAQLKRPRGMLKSRACYLGLAKKADTDRRWTAEEDALLQALIERGYAVRAIHKRMAKAGHPRSLSAIVSRVSKSDGLVWERDFLTAADVASLFGVDSKTALGWLRAGQLKGKRGQGPSSTREVTDERLLWQVRYDDIPAFMLAYPGYWDHRKISQEVLLDLLRPGELNRIARKEMA
jgi:hypothetical protein